MAKDEGKLTEACHYYEKSIELKSLIVLSTGTAAARRSLTVSYNSLGGVYKSQRNVTRARELYEKALAIRIEIENETGTVEAKRDLSGSYNHVGETYEEEGQ
ncbi:MAG: tetratricopeptide repeat protein, partial [Clostridia bacterium]|nr:tetratricopeptide repeat protein [Clostridia bacterium]